MSGDYRSRSRDAGRAVHHYEFDDDDTRGRSDRQQQQHGYYDDHRTSRQDYSRSPRRNELDYDDGAEERAYDGDSYRDDHDGYSRREYGRRDDNGRREYQRSRYSPGRRGRSASPRRGPGSPSDTVILEALPADISTEEVRDALHKFADMSSYPSFDVRVPPGRGRRAFVQFERTDDAVDFVENNYPKLALDFEGRADGDADGKTNIYIHFARNREEPDARTHGQNWTCSVCDYSNYSTRNRCKSCGGPQTDASSYRHMLTGESDASDTPSQILVFYPLAASVTEDVLAVGAAKLELVEKPPAPRQPGDPPKLKSTAPTGDTSGFGARPGSLHRVFLMRARDNNESFKFGFAEFWTVDDALAAMTKFKKFREFTIASAAVNVSTIHLGVFVPELREIHPSIETQSFPPLFNPAIRVKYWDPHVYPSQKIITDAPPDGTKTSEADDGTANDAKKSKKRKADAALATGAAKKAVPMAGQMAFWQKRHDEIHEGKPKPNAEQDAAELGNRHPVKISLSSTKPPERQPMKIALAPETVAGVRRSSPQGNESQSATPDPAPQASRDAGVVSYVDREKVCCLLCMMKYKSLDDLNTHERSRNHKTAMEDEDKVKKGKERLAKRGLLSQLGPTSDDSAKADTEGSLYRDRAKERREVYNQPKRPSAQDAPRKDKHPAVKPREPSPQPVKSKGSSMLAKMGWTSGQGLGAKGEGRTEVIETNAYQEGVGLGAEGGKLGDAAELAQKRTTNNYAEYLSSAQDKARERYNRLG